jgi:hypothetical protein
MEIPQRKINSSNGLGERPGLPALQRQHRGALRESLESLRGTIKLAPDHRRREHLIDEPRSMFGAGRRKVRPDLAPADDAVFVFGANEHRRTVQHAAERGHHRRRERIAIAKRLDCANGEGHLWIQRSHPLAIKVTTLPVRD